MTGRGASERGALIRFPLPSRPPDRKNRYPSPEIRARSNPGVRPRFAARISVSGS